MRPRTAAGFVLLILIGVVGPASAADHALSPVVARVYGAEIRLSDISPPGARVARDKKAMKPSPYDARLKEIRKNRLEQMIWTKVTERAVGGADLQPTEKEIQELVAFIDRKRAGRTEVFRGKRDDVRRKLIRRGLRPAERASLEKNLKTMDRLLDQMIAIDKAERQRAKTIPNYDKIKRRSAEKGSRITIRSWKMNKALYEKYGGRVIFQQLGLEPIDAYAAVIAEAERTRAVVILDASFPPPFERMKKYLKMGHNYMPKGTHTDYFTTPWWLKGG